MDDIEQHADLKIYLRRLRWALAALPERDRDEVVEETRLHVLERVESGRPLEQVLAALGPAPAYAQSFLDEMEISGVLASQRSGAMLRVVARRAQRSLVAAAALAVVLLLAASAALTLSVAVFEIGDPVHTGLWVSQDQTFIGVIDDPSSARELLGGWIFVLAAVNALLAWWLGRLVLLRAIRAIARAD